MNFATLKGLTIPEGNVTKITDALGNVLWSAVRMANLTITSFLDGMDGDTARITINSPSPFAPNPNEPNNKVTSWTAYVYDLFDQQNRTIKIPVGSTIECYITRDKENADSYIKLNGVNVATGEGTYIYTVTGDAIIDVSEDYIQGDFGVITITEIPKGHELVNITGKGNEYYCYVILDSVKYTEAATVVVPIGKKIYCYVRSQNQGYAEIVLPNNERIYSENAVSSYYNAEYYYAVSGNVQIKLSHDSIVKAGSITITET